jgi:hypothetical protein
MVFVALWAALKVGPWAIGGFTEARWRLADRTRLLEQSRSMVLREPAIRDSATSVKDAIVALAPRLLSGGTQAEAADALGGLVNRAADQSNARLTGTSPEADSVQVGMLRRVAVRAAFDCDIRGLVSLLGFFAAQETLVLTDALRVVAEDAVAQGDGPEVLHMEVTLRGWYQETGRPDQLSDMVNQ